MIVYTTSFDIKLIGIVIGRILNIKTLLTASLNVNFVLEAICILS